jgi:putative ATP-dependent endonuclease of OLD family
MLLRSLRIRFFRAIASAQVDFEHATTVWIGENDCGKTSLLEALAMALGGDDPEAPPVFARPHLHYLGDTDDAEVAGSPSIELIFEERHAGEVPATSPLTRVLGRAAGRPRTLRLSIEGRLERDAIVTTFAVSGAKSAPSVDDGALLAALRRAHPLLWIRGGMLSGADLVASSAAQTATHQRAALAPEVDALVKDLELRYARVVTGESLHIGRDVAAAAAAAQKLLQLRGEGADSAQLAEGAMIAEIVGAHGGRVAPIERGRSRLGAATQQLGVLILVAALVRSRRAGLAQDGDPIILVEDPEAHLHPMTLATVWDLLSQIGWQKIVTTQSGVLLSGAALSSLRRLVRAEGHVHSYAIRADGIGRDALRKFSYHVRFRRGTAMFARAWLLVEGETEFWLVSEVARLMGFDLRQEGVAVVEFAQSGLAPLVKVADALGIGWHVLTDGDHAGDVYAQKARGLSYPRPAQAHVSQLVERDIEHCFYAHGYKNVFVRRAKLGAVGPGVTASRIIKKAIERESKPAIAFALMEAVGAARSAGVPEPLQQAIDRVLRLAWSPPSPPRPRSR